MSEQRQLFRFRFPWASSGPPAPKPATDIPPPPPPNNAPPPPASPPRPASVYTTPLPFRSSASQPSSPRGGSTNGSSGASQPPPPPLPGTVSTFGFPFRSSVSQPSSPRGSTAGSGTASQPSSPPKTIPLTQTSSLPSSPVRQPQVASSTSVGQQKTQTAISQETKPSSPDKKVVNAIQESSSAKARDAHPNPEPESENLPRKAEEEKKPAEEYLKEEKAKARTHKESKKKQESLEIKKTIPDSKSHGLPHSNHEGNHNVRDSRRKFGSWKAKHDHAFPHKEIKEDTLKLVHGLTTGKTIFRVEDSDYPVHVITVAGENKGASMYLSSDSESSNKDAPIHIHRGYRSNPDESIDATTEVDDSSKQDTTEEPKKLEEEEEAAPEAYVNSNVQSVNNSIVFESSISERNPGVEFLSSSSKNKHNELSSNKVESVESHKAEFNPIPIERITYQPNIRRRCLRGLFLESSDSDPDNPDKPRRHGCRYGCWERSKDKDADTI